MASTFTTSLRLVKQGVGDNDSTWGTIFNQQFADLIDAAIAGYNSIALSDADKTLTATNGTADESRSMMLNFTGALTQARNIIVPASTKLYFVRNNTTGGFKLTVKTPSGSGVDVENGGSIALACDGTDVVTLISALQLGATISGYEIGYMEIPQVSKSADYTLALGDRGKHIYHPSTDAEWRIWTIPANGSVPYPIGTTLTFVNENGAGGVTITIDTDTLTLAGSGATGARTLAAAGVATALKTTATRWIISGTNIT